MAKGKPNKGRISTEAVVDAPGSTSFIEGGAGDDVLIGSAEADRFMLREGGGDDVIEGFQVGVDRLGFDFSSYSDVLGFGTDIQDGTVITDFSGQTSILVQSVDVNGDGITDTMFTVNGADSIALLGVAPDDLASGSLFGG
jgi:Ca2+-binding RTX toxin-like protein